MYQSQETEDYNSIWIKAQRDLDISNFQLMDWVVLGQGDSSRKVTDDNLIPPTNIEEDSR